MYKTVRQGENSLQYTILPQQDDGRTAPPTQGPRRGGGSGHSRKKSVLAYIGLFFVCAIITFAILIPLMVTSDLMPTPATWFYRNQKVRDFRNPVNVKLSIDNRPETHIIKGTPLRTTVITSTTTTTSTTESPSTKANAPLWSDALTVTEFQNLYKSDESMEQAAGDQLGSNHIFSTTGRPTISTTTTTSPVNLLLARAKQRMTSTTISPVATPTAGQGRNYPRHFSLQKYEKPTETEVIEQETKALHVETSTGDMSQGNHQNWLQSHWSYVNPYLQWKSYAPDDRVVLPLILGVTLTTVVLIILLCYLVKRKRMCGMCKRSSATANNRNTFESVEAQNEDHENLLTNENHSEDE